MSEEDRKKAIPDERLYKVACQEVASLGCPTNKEGLEKIAEQFLAQAKASNDMRAVNEYIKLRMKVLPKESETSAKFEEYAVAALAGDSNRNNKIPLAQNLYRRLVKSGAQGLVFKEKARQYFKYANTFQE